MVNLPSLRDIINSYNLHAKKSLGQNFLLNMDITRRIARAAGACDGTTVMEIGAGPGGLTRALLETGACVVAIERDSRCLKILDQLQNFYPDRLRLIEGDALTLSPQSVIDTGAIKIVANLPYNIATTLLIKWLGQLERIQSLTLMFQKEVALRLVARPCTRDYGRLSVLVQWLCTSQRLFDLSPGAFMPAPRVTSSVVHLVPRDVIYSVARLMPVLSTVTGQAFGQRRKMIRTSLKLLFNEKVLLDLGLDPCARAEQLSVASFVDLANHYYENYRIENNN